MVATQIFFYIFTLKLGEMIQFDEHFFQMGWFNHQLAWLILYSFFFLKGLNLHLHFAVVDLVTPSDQSLLTFLLYFSLLVRIFGVDSLVTWAGNCHVGLLMD